MLRYFGFGKMQQHANKNFRTVIVEEDSAVNKVCLSGRNILLRNIDRNLDDTMKMIWKIAYGKLQWNSFDKSSLSMWMVMLWWPSG